MMNRNKIIVLYVIMFCILITMSYAFGLMPSRKIIDMTPDLQQQGEFRIMNSENKDFNVIVYPRGELSEFVSIETKAIHLTEHDGSVTVQYTIAVPAQYRRPGTQTIDIVVEEISSQATEQIGVGGKIALVHQAVLKSSYLGSFINAYATTNNPQLGEPASITLTIANEGTEDISSLHAIVEVYNEEFTLITSERAELSAIAAGVKRKDVVQLSKQLPPGNYYVTTTVFYDGKSTALQIPLSVGGPFVEIASIGSSQFVLGRINQLDVAIQNKWSESMSGIFAEITVRTLEGNVVTAFKTLSLDLPAFASGTLFGYWDTASVKPGTYILSIDMNYNGRASQKDFAVDVLADGLLVSNKEITSNVAAGSRSAFDPSLSILIVVIILLVLINLLLVFYIRRRQQSS